MTVATIIQARLGSTRLPGKVFLPLGETNVLAEVIRRCRAIPGGDLVCCAIPEGSEDDPLAAAAEALDTVVVRGSEQDVLSRYMAAADAVQADHIIRITADKPLIDPVICGNVLRALQNAGADFACNNMPAGWPHGLDCEIFTYDLLKRAHTNATTAAEREHVTPWMRARADVARVNLTGPGGRCTEMRWTLDLPDDNAFLVALFEKLPPPPAIPLFDDIMAILTACPEITALNAAHQHLVRTAGEEAGAVQVGVTEIETPTPDHTDMDQAS